MSKLTKEDRIRVVACLVEGSSLRATVRMTGVHRTTIQKLLVELGAACSDYLDQHLVNLNSKRIQCDEIWSFVHAKQKNAPTSSRRGDPTIGDCWTWTAIDADSKLLQKRPRLVTQAT